ncbi:transcription factor-like protein DPB, partial [Tanacetum coccineum]
VAAAKRGLGLIIVYDKLTRPTFGMTDRKEIQWQGLPNSNLSNVHELKREHLALWSRIDKKACYLKELQDQVRSIT